MKINVIRLYNCCVPLKKTGLSELKEYSDFREFVKFNEDFINDSTFVYFNLDRTVRRVLKGEVPVYKFFNVIEGDHICCGLLIQEECLLYASEITETMIPLIAEGLEFDKFKRYQFFGTKNVIDSLFDTYNVKYSEQKHRKYYECTTVELPFDYAQGEAVMGELERIQELIELHEIFKGSFYEHENTSGNAEAIIYNGILKRNIYQWIYEGQLVGMAQVMYDECDYPVIGHVCTLPDFRSKGIAASLTHKITEGLIQNGHEKCFLMTDAYNPASNKAFQKVGYQLIGEYVVRYKEK